MRYKITCLKFYIKEISIQINKQFNNFKIMSNNKYLPQYSPIKKFNEQKSNYTDLSETVERFRGQSTRSRKKIF